MMLNRRMPRPSLGRGIIAFIVRSAMHHRLAHRLNFFLQYRFSAQAQETRDSTHIDSLISKSSSQPECQVRGVAPRQRKEHKTHKIKEHKKQPNDPRPNAHSSKWNPNFLPAFSPSEVKQISHGLNGFNGFNRFNR